MEERLIIERKKLLESITKLPQPIVSNREWIYLLKEETRNSILIEGYFVDEEELENVLAGNIAISKSREEAIKYFRTAKFIYNLAYENYLSKEFLFGIPLIRQINKELGFKGEFRKGKVKIAGAKFEPPEYFIDDWLKIYIDLVKDIERDFFNILAVSHAFFEEIHPFEDGNGRTGRILLNYILISYGYPLVIIKGDNKTKRKYYKGLEEIDIQLSPIFERFKNKKPNKGEVVENLKNVKSKILKEIILNSLRENLDMLILGEMERKGHILEPVGNLIKSLGYSSESSRKLIQRGKIIATKRKNSWYSTKALISFFLRK